MACASREAGAQRRDAASAEEAAGRRCGDLVFYYKAAVVAASDFIKPLREHGGTEGAHDQRGSEAVGKSCRWYLGLFHTTTSFD